MNTIIVRCTCISRFQDEMYGQGNRVHNLAKKNNSYRCTICKAERGAGGSPKDVKKK